MAKTAIVLASKTEQENFLLHKKLEELCEQFRGLEFVGVHLLGLSGAVERNTAIVVINLNEWTSREAVHLDELRHAGFSGPILVTAKGEVNAAVKAMKAREGVVFLEKPYVLKDLQGMVRKFLTARAVSQRIHRRYQTSQEAAIVTIGLKSETFSSRVRNLSKGGAFLELKGPATFKVGEMVKVAMELQDLQRTYLMPAKIVWTSKLGARAGGGLGVEFIGPGDLAKNVVGY